MLAQMTFALPPPLSPGDTIAVVAPSGALAGDELWRGLAWLRIRYRIRMRAGVLSHDGYLAGDDDRRGDELASAMMDPEVKAIVAARGGYGSMRILDALPWGELAKRPKWIVGYSDVTALHAMAWRAGIASIHGPNVVGLGPDASVWTRFAWLAALGRRRGARTWSALRVVRPGEATGPIVGGNLALVHAMAAAGRLTIPQGSVLALEDVTEAPFRVDRMLTSLLLGGHLARATAIVFGGFDKCPVGADGRTVDEVLDNCTRPLGIPVLAGAPFGHGPRNDSFVLGAVVRVGGNAVVWGSGQERTP
jgi:muramoyltetrapeptide carboxypeptidase